MTQRELLLEVATKVLIGFSGNYAAINRDGVNEIQEMEIIADRVGVAIEYADTLIKCVNQYDLSK